MSPQKDFLFAFFDPPGAAHGMHGCPLAREWELTHGEHCSCRLLAAATCTEPTAIDYAYCHDVLQKRWRLVCDHVPNIPRQNVKREVPPHDSRDPVHALLIANADVSTD